MSSSVIEHVEGLASTVEVSDDTLTVHLSDGRAIAVPLLWYPRLLHGNTQERSTYRLLGQGRGIHWPLLDEDISVSNLLLGQRSQESQQSLKKWLDVRVQS